MHRPDLVVWGERGPGERGGFAVEIELSEKAPRRLDAILRAWRRAVANEVVSGVQYYCSERAYRGVLRAVERTATAGPVRVGRIDALTARAKVPGEGRSAGSINGRLSRELGARP